MNTEPNYTTQYDEQIAEIIKHLKQLESWDAAGISGTEEVLQYVNDVLKNWVPIAEEIGMAQEQAKMQNLCVKLGYPEDYRKLKKLLADSEASCEIVFKTFALPIEAMLSDLGIEYTFKYRMKSVYSIWRKMRIDNKEFDDVFDLFAARIVYKPKETIDALMDDNTIDGEEEVRAVKEWQLKGLDAEKFYCWRIYTVISALYRIHPDRIKNWITHPKPSGYQALQLTVMGPDCNWIEIQIRSERMDYEAEHGIAAHWRYKREKNTH